MTPRLHSINGLSTETGMDRRTIAKRLAGLPPDGKVSGHDAWFLKSAWPHLVATDRAASGGADAEAERARLLRAQADMAELKLAEARGQLVDRVKLTWRWETQYRTIRDLLRMIPMSCSEKLMAVASDGRAPFAAALLAEIDDGLRRASQAPAQHVQSEEATDDDAA